jgi:hypothetical protein
MGHHRAIGPFVSFRPAHGCHPSSPTITRITHGTCVTRRALAALFKELHKSSLQGLAIELFDWLRGMPPGQELTSLLDVYTYTTMIVRGRHGPRGLGFKDWPVE